MTTLGIKRFDPSTISPNSKILVIGPKGSGKSTIAKDVAYRNRGKFHNGVCMGAEHNTRELASFLPLPRMHTEFSGTALETVLAQGTGESDPKHVYVILEDVAFDHVTMRGEAMRQALASPHAFLLHTMQYLYKSLKEWRRYDYIVVTRPHLNDDNLYRCFGDRFWDFDTFTRVVNENTQGYNCVVFNLGSQSNKIEDTVFYYKADLDPSQPLSGSDIVGPGHTQ